MSRFLHSQSAAYLEWKRPAMDKQGPGRLASRRSSGQLVKGSVDDARDRTPLDDVETIFVGLGSGYDNRARPSAGPAATGTGVGWRFFTCAPNPPADHAGAAPMAEGQKKAANRRLQSIRHAPRSGLARKLGRQYRYLLISAAQPDNQPARQGAGISTRLCAPGAVRRGG